VRYHQKRKSHLARHVGCGVTSTNVIDGMEKRLFFFKLFELSVVSIHVVKLAHGQRLCHSAVQISYMYIQVCTSLADTCIYLSRDSNMLLPACMGRGTASIRRSLR
jgi:hypothetical protein